MSGARPGRSGGLIATLLALAALTAGVAGLERAGGESKGVAQAAVRGAAEPAARGNWRPAFRAARAYARRRAGDVRFSIQRWDLRRFRYRAGRAAPLRSVFKVMLMTAYLRKGSVRSRQLRREERKLLGTMIKRSDDAAASEINRRLSARKIAGLARRAKMRRFSYSPVIWGDSRSSTGDQVRLMRRLRRLLPARHRGYGLGLMRRIVGSQRWGVADVRTPGWKLFFKSGWGSGTGEADHQVAILRRHRCTIALAIFTVHNPSHSYARKTQRGVAKRLLRGLNRGVC